MGRLAVGQGQRHVIGDGDEGDLSLHVGRGGRARFGDVEPAWAENAFLSARSDSSRRSDWPTSSTSCRRTCRSGCRAWPTRRCSDRLRPSPCSCRGVTRLNRLAAVARQRNNAIFSEKTVVLGHEAAARLVNHRVVEIEPALYAGVCSKKGESIANTEYR